MKRTAFHRKPGLVIPLVAFTILAVQFARAQDRTTTQLVMLQVREINKIGLVGGAVTLQVGSAGGDRLEPSTDASTRLLWTSNGDNRKIAVASNVTSPRFVLRIQAEQINPGSGVAEPEVTLSDNEPHDLILGVRRTAGGCTLKFTAAAEPEEGIGSESHLITYTITGC